MEGNSREKWIVEKEREVAELTVKDCWTNSKMDMSEKWRISCR